MDLLGDPIDDSADLIFFVKVGDFDRTVVFIVGIVKNDQGYGIYNPEMN